MDKLNKTFQSEQILTADEMNQITSKIDEVIIEVNEYGNILGEISTQLDTLNGEVI